MILHNVIFAVLSERTRACVMGVKCENRVHRGCCVGDRVGGTLLALLQTVTPTTSAQSKFQLQ